MIKRCLQPATIFLLLLLIAGCNTGIIVHDQIRAAELIVDFMSGFKSEEGRQLSYDWTDDEFKKEVSRADFSRMVASTRELNQGADIQLIGYEVFGPVETMIVYASSQAGEEKVYFRFILVGTKTKDYYLLSFDISASDFDKKGVYSEYEQALIIQGV